MTDAEIVEIRKACYGGRFGKPETSPWADSLKFARAIETEVLERAAQECNWLICEHPESDEEATTSTAAEKCASAIRALKVTT